MTGPLPIAILALLGIVSAARVDERTLVPPCSRSKEVPASPGEVVRLFELRKDHNPENVLVIYTYADAQCRVIGSLEHKEQLVDMYWRMDHRSPDECYKPTHPRIKSETLKSLEVKSLSADRRRFKIDIKRLDQLEHDLPTREAEITLRRTAPGCEAEVRLPLESRNGAVLRLQAVNARGAHPFAVAGHHVEALELLGVDAQNRPIRRLYRSK